MVSLAFSVSQPAIESVISKCPILKTVFFLYSANICSNTACIHQTGSQLNVHGENYFFDILTVKRKIPVILNDNTSHYIGRLDAVINGFNL